MHCPYHKLAMQVSINCLQGTPPLLSTHANEWVTQSSCLNVSLVAAERADIKHIPADLHNGAHIPYRETCQFSMCTSQLLRASAGVCTHIFHLLVL